MTYEEVLEVLLGWLGRTLSVGISTLGERAVLIANMLGTLQAGSELSADDSEGAVFFHFENAGTGFVLARESFTGAGWHQDDESVLVVRLRAVSLWIDPDPEFEGGR
jgi:hypothetical protein